MKRLWLSCLYLFSWLVFGSVSLALNLACILVLPWRRRAGTGRRARASIRLLFDLWSRWLHASRLVRVDWCGFPEKLPPGCVYVANHPGLLDAPLLLSRIPEAFCVFKPSLLRNPAVGPAAVVAGYSAGDSGFELLRDASDKVRSGQSLLIFPEGTRTTEGTRLGTLRAGFALIAQRAAAPLGVITIRSTPGLLSKGAPWWRPPQVFPARLEFRWLGFVPHEPARTTQELTALLTERFTRDLAACEPTSAPQTPRADPEPQPGAAAGRDGALRPRGLGTGVGGR